MTSKSRGASTARTFGGAALGAIIGAAADRGNGAAIDAGFEIVTRGDRVKVPSETLLEFTLQRDVSIPKRSS